jgi:hypothetical protein
MKDFYFNMHNIKILICYFIVTLPMEHSMAASMSKQEFDKAVKGSTSFEDGYYDTKTGDKAEFTRYICEHWLSLLESYEPNENNNDPNNKTLTIDLICFAAENLPPIQYVDFLDKLLDILEARDFGFDDPSTLFHGRNAKYSFLQVNWEHPRVQAILQRQIKLFANDPIAISALKSTASGKLADSYRTNVPDDAPYPETLPGIKLLPPDGVLLKKIRSMIPSFTGGPPLSAGPTRQQRERPSHPDDLASTPLSGSYRAWPWLTILGLLGGLITGIWKYRSGSNRTRKFTEADR